MFPQFFFVLFWKGGKSLQSKANLFSLLMWSLLCLFLFMFISINILAVQLFFQVNEEYFRTLEILSKKLKFVEADQLIKGSKALKDVQPELEKLRQKAVTKVDNSTRCRMDWLVSILLNHLLINYSSNDFLLQNRFLLIAYLGNVYIDIALY